MKRAIRSVLRLLAAGLIVFGIMIVGLEWMRLRSPKAEVNAWQFVLGGVLALAGVGLFALSTRLAEQLADDFEE